MWKLIFTTLEFYRECRPIKCECHLCTRSCVSQGRKIHFYQTWKLIFTALEFYRECRPIKRECHLCTRSWHGSLRVSQGRKIYFYQTWKLIFTTLEFYRECQPIKWVLPVYTGGKQLIITTMEIYFLPLWKLLFTTIEDIVNVWLHLNSLLW